MTIAHRTRFENSTGSSTNTYALTGVTYVSGDLVKIFVEFIVLGGATDVSTLSDGTNTYTKKGLVFGSWGVSAWECRNPTPGTYTLTATLNGTASFGLGIVADCESGADNSVATLLIAAKTDDPASTSADALVSSSYTPSQQPGMATTYQVADQSGAAPAAGSGTTLVAALTNVNGNLASACIGYKRFTSTSADTLKYTAAVANRQIGIGLVSYEAGASTSRRKLIGELMA